MRDSGEQAAVGAIGDCNSDEPNNNVHLAAAATTSADISKQVQREITADEEDRKEEMRPQHTVIECHQPRKVEPLMANGALLEKPPAAATCKSGGDTFQTSASGDVELQLSERLGQQPQIEKVTNNQNSPPPKSPPNQISQKTTKKINKQNGCPTKRLTYLQSLLLRKWPCLALTICIMSSLLFGILLSALTVYLMHGVTDCSALFAASSSSSGSLPSIGAAAPRPPPHLMGEGKDQFVGAGELDPTASLLGVENPPLYVSGGEQLAPQKQFKRLPSSVWPQHYELFLEPHIAEPHFNFTGRLAIWLEVREPTDRIILHSNELQVDERLVALAVASKNGSQQQEEAPKIKALSVDKRLQHLIVELERPLTVGRDYVLSMEFKGNLNDDLAGFYKIRYERQNSNETTWIAATQFQATDARRAFPCFDEPLYKATFSIQIKHWRNMSALSNMPIVRSEVSPDGLWVTDTFAKSHKMSTYLVAYAVTNFESRSLGNISVWTRPGFAHTAEYALQIAGKILRHYEDFFGIEYPLPKMDMIALPDFNAGAMENWGLITYRETAMLYDESQSSLVNKQRVAVVVAHELAHQWFGNLVTPKWWDDLWLNEGFASYVEYIGVDHVEPQWRMLDQFVVEEVQNVFKMDGLSSSHQISIPVNNPDEISEIFDHISYAKGASIIRMMNHFLTERVFKLGLRRYLRALRYSNAEQSDLWQHLTEAQRLVSSEASNATSSTQVDVQRVMNSWTLQTGYPLVTLTRSYGQDKKKAKLEQWRYQPYKAADNSTSRSAQRWDIPITYTWRSEQNWEPVTRLWMESNSTSGVKEFSMEAKDDEWMVVNVQQVGYYRVNYDQRNWRLLVQQLDQDHTRLGTINRAQLLDDLFELARSGSLDYQLAMEATKYLRKERDYLPWDAVIGSFNYIDDMLQRTPIYGAWKDYTMDLIQPYYERYLDADWTSRINSSSLVPNGNDILELYNLVNAISSACDASSAHCIEKAKRLFRQWRSTGVNQINPALRFTAYCTAIRNGDKDDWDFLWRQYEREQNASERDRIMRALGCSREYWILARYLDWTFSKSKQIRRQDGTFVFRTIAKNHYGRDIAFNFMRERWATIKEYYGKTSFSLGNLIRSISATMNSQVELEQLVAFYDSIKADVGTGRRAFLIAIEEAESNVAWRQRNYRNIEDWLQAKMAAASTQSSQSNQSKRKRTVAAAA